MYLGKTLFAQVMDFLPWKTFHRIVDRYGGDYRTRSLRCAEQFRVMAFAQLTYRESLRISRCVWGLKPASSITWASGRRSHARHWPTPTSRATGAILRVCPAADRQGPCTLRRRRL